MHDVIVVGAGLSGLSAAQRLAGRGRDVLVLEARDRVGGRTYSAPLAGDTIDLGGQWIGPTQNRVAELASELGVETFKQHTDGKKTVELGGRRHVFEGLLPKLGVLDLADLGFNMTRVNSLAKRLDPARPGAAKQARRWDALTTESWLLDHTRTARSLSLFKIAVEMVFAAEPREISFLFFLFYLRSGGSWWRLIAADRGAQERRFVGGAQELSLRMAKRLDARVRLNAPVTAVRQDDDGIVVVTRAGEERAHYCVVALSPSMCEGIEFEPELPMSRRELQKRMPMGSVIKCVVAYERPFWRERGFSGEAVSDGWPIRAVFDDGSHDGKHAALVAFIVGDAARDCSKLDPDQRKGHVLDALARIFDTDDAKRAVDYVDKDWTSDEWAGGCYTGIMPPGVMTSVGHALRAPCGRIHFAGTEAATKWAGYFDGAITSGERAADEIIARLGEKAA